MKFSAVEQDLWRGNEIFGGGTESQENAYNNVIGATSADVFVPPPKFSLRRRKFRSTVEIRSSIHMVDH